MRTLKQSSVFALGLALLLPGTLMAGELTNQANTRKEAIKLTKHIERTSLTIQKEADRLDAMSRNSRISNATHKRGLQQIRNHVNEQLQPAFSRLAELKPELPEWHQSAIAEMHSSALDLAANADAAIRNRNPDGSGRVATVDQDYKQLIASINEHSSELAEVADATADYGSAQLKGHMAGLAITTHD
ncbi:MAG TPA: hypothetical protein VN753_11320 [Terracidiphilus sp.]|jgi:phosphate uptake regulator|nr:hypothetical protein [Terracidiphilus sp.]